MSERHIIVAITPDEDGVRCGECQWRVIGSYSDNRDWCGMFSENSDEIQEIVAGKRVERCLAAERKLAALIEAGEAMARRYGYDLAEAWDRAVADIKGGK